MNTCLTHEEKEVIALDADDHLMRPVLFLFDFSDLRLFQVRVDRLKMRGRLPALCAA